MKNEGVAFGDDLEVFSDAFLIPFVAQPLHNSSLFIFHHSLIEASAYYGRADPMQNTGIFFVDKTYL